MRKSVLFMALPLVLAACSGGSDSAGDQSAQDAAEEAVEKAEAQPSKVAEPDGADAESAMAIPAKYAGVWDGVQGSCALESDLRMEIADKKITFYESSGIATKVEMEGEDALVSLDMSGEGETWKEVLRLSLSADGKTLETSDGEKPKVADDAPRKRCAA